MTSTSDEENKVYIITFTVEPRALKVIILPNRFKIVTFVPLLLLSCALIKEIPCTIGICFEHIPSWSTL